MTAFDLVYPFEFQEKYNTSYAGLVEVQLKEAFYVIVGDPTKFKDYLDMNYIDYVPYLHSRSNVIEEQKEKMNNNKS